jgi:hypothetical protein
MKLDDRTERIKQIVTLVATFAGILGPSLSAFNPGASDVGQVSEQFFSDVPIIPADYTFAIWAPIYLGFLAFAVFQALPAQRRNPRFARVRPWLTASAILNAVWIPVFNNQYFALSLLVIVVMLAIALRMHRLLEIGKTKVYGLERVLRVPFSLYAGWLTAATILNAAGVLAVQNWNGFGLSYPTWGLIMLVVASIVGLTTRFYWHDPVYGAVFVWAFVGVVFAQSGASNIALLAGALAVLFALSLIAPVRLGTSRSASA